MFGVGAFGSLRKLHKGIIMGTLYLGHGELKAHVLQGAVCTTESLKRFAVTALNSNENILL